MDNKSDELLSSVYADLKSIESYREYELEIGKLGREIMKRLGSDRALFLGYEKLMYLVEGICIERAYGIGTNDADNAQQNA